MNELTKTGAVAAAKQLRKDLDAVLQNLKAEKSDLRKLGGTECEDHGEAMAQITLSQRDLENAIMRLGMTLKAIGNPNPYPESYNPASPVVEPTADGLKL